MLQYQVGTRIHVPGVGMWYLAQKSTKKINIYLVKKLLQNFKFKSWCDYFLFHREIPAMHLSELNCSDKIMQSLILKGHNLITVADEVFLRFVFIVPNHGYFQQGMTTIIVLQVKTS